MAKRDRILIRVQYSEIPEYLALGWIAIIPTLYDYQHIYGIFMEWLCDCPPLKPKRDSHV